MDIIFPREAGGARTVDTHCFFLCCGALVNVTSSLERVESLANEYVRFTRQSTLTHMNRLKPANLFAFNARAFHPIYATTFILNFFHYVIIDGRKFDSVAGLLFSSSTLSRHTGILRFWAHDTVVKSCTFKWAHSRTQPLGESVPYQCPTCHCIQAWDQTGQGPSSELRKNVTMGCRYVGEQGRCTEELHFIMPSLPFKALKQPEGVWVAFGVGKSDFL